MKIVFILFVCSSFLFAHFQERVWEVYKDSFIKRDGRVVDYYNHITHTEGIGYTLYFAYKMDDEKTFQKVYQWYKKNMKYNKFHLPAWKWGKDKQKRCFCVLDTTSATDANLWIAYDLYKMYQKTHNILYKKDADALVRAIKKEQIIFIHKIPYLLPWEKNKIDKNNIKLNPSYMIFEIFQFLAKQTGDKVWLQLIQNAKTTLLRARFSALALNSDWVIYDTKQDRYILPDNSYFGYDAIRIPLNILRSDLSQQIKRKLLQPYKNYIKMMVGHPLGVVALQKGEISLYNLSFGHLAIYKKIAKFYKMDTTLFDNELKKRIPKEQKDYYSYALFFLSIL
ncbi:Endoglucanase precursor [hydrothermal vent metagenome]|uniref:Endoglucanase n=1 Tax=hydrothermal vent metagenome TaxID=652676 RepID=A0A1W1D5I6_9ZZZZ